MKKKNRTPDELNLDVMETMNESAALCLSFIGAMGEEWFSNLFLQSRKRKLYLGRALMGEHGHPKYLNEDYSKYWYEDWKRGTNLVFPLRAFWYEEELKKLISISDESEEVFRKNLSRFYESSGKRGWRFVREGILGVPVQNIRNDYPGYFVYIDVQESGGFLVSVGKKNRGGEEINLPSSKHLYVKGDVSKHLPQVSVGIYRPELEIEEEDSTITMGETYKLSLYKLSLVSYVFPEDGDDRTLEEKMEEEEVDLEVMFIGLSSIISSAIKVLTSSATPASWGKALMALSKANYLLYKM